MRLFMPFALAILAWAMLGGFVWLVYAVMTRK